jgi:hypothetical protein
MNPTIIRLLMGALALAIPAGHAAEPLSVSGIYPHLAVFNSDPKREKPEMECGLGTAVPWAGKLWITTYTSHALGRGNDKLFAILPDMSLEIRPESVGGTSACRMIHRESKQLFIASYAIDEAGKDRFSTPDATYVELICGRIGIRGMGPFDLTYAPDGWCGTVDGTRRTLVMSSPDQLTRPMLLLDGQVWASGIPDEPSPWRGREEVQFGLAAGVESGRQEFEVIPWQWPAMPPAPARAALP